MGSRRDLPTRGGLPRTPRYDPRAYFSLALIFLVAICGVAVRPAVAGVRADVDRDGRTDVVRLEASRGRITIALGGSTKLLVLPSIDSVKVVALSDIDGDGDLDIVGLSDHDGILVWRNTGLGRFIAARPAKSRLIVRRTGPRIGRARAAGCEPDSAFTDPERHAVVEAALDLFRASPVPSTDSAVEPTRSAPAVPSASRAPPARLLS